MGEMADFFLEHVEEEEYDRLRYKRGEMSDLEAFEMGIIDEMGYLIENNGQGRTCKYCKMGSLAWKQLENGWRLVDRKGNVHTCSKYQPL